LCGWSQEWDLAIHWSFDKTQGIAQGRQVANWVFTHAFKPVSR
jgi:hypothetical protein